MTSEAWRRLSCRDWAGRSRQVTVRMRADRMVLIAPPGESAELELEAMRALWYTLGTAIGAAGMR